MKAKKYWILIALMGSILLRPIVVANEKAIEKAEPKVNVADKTANRTDVEVELLREQIRSLEATIEKLKEETTRHDIPTGWGTMPGLRGSLAGLPGIGIRIEKLPLMAVRHGLTRKNILRAIESQLKKYNIKNFDIEAEPSGESQEELNLRSKIVLNCEPQLNIYVGCEASEAGNYMAFVGVSMKQYWSRDSLNSMSSVKSYVYITTWERQCVLLGKLENFAEDERNSLEELVGEFINDYLAANPKEQPVSVEEKDKKPKDN